MPKVKGKEQLCSCERYETYFKSIQGLGSHTLFDRYSDIENIVNKRIDENYRHFLAQPEVDGDTIYWFSKPYGETPRRLSELQGEERAKYERIKNDTLAHYQSVIASLKAEGKNSEAECLEKATKFVNDYFVYCYDGKTVLGIWGMQLRDEVRDPLGIAMKNASFKEKKKPQPEPEPEPEPEDNDEPEDEDNDEPEDEDEEQAENPYSERFSAGDSSMLTDDSESTVPDGGISQGAVAVPWWSRFWGAGKGCLNWLLLLLLLALIFMAIWCCLLKKCNFSFCGCNCDETAVVIPEPKDVNTKPTVNSCNAQVNSGGDEGYVGLFEMGQPSGSFVFEYNTKNVPDKITVYDGAGMSGKVIFKYEGSTVNMVNADIQFNQPTITVEVIGQAQGTYWEFKINCPKK